MRRNKWKKLKKDWEQLDPKALEAYRVAKLEKWENKRIKNRMEKESNIHSLIGTVINLSSVAIGLLSGSFPAGILTVPTVLFGLKAIKTGISTNRFFIKRSIKKMNFQLAQAYYKPSIKPQKLAR